MSFEDAKKLSADIQKEIVNAKKNGVPEAYIKKIEHYDIFIEMKTAVDNHIESMAISSIHDAIRNLPVDIQRANIEDAARRIKAAQDAVAKAKADGISNEKIEEVERYSYIQVAADEIARLNEKLVKVIKFEELAKVLPKIEDIKIIPETRVISEVLENIIIDAQVAYGNLDVDQKKLALEDVVASYTVISEKYEEVLEQMLSPIYELEDRIDDVDVEIDDLTLKNKDQITEIMDIKAHKNSFTDEQKKLIDKDCLAKLEGFLNKIDSLEKEEEAKNAADNEIVDQLIAKLIALPDVTVLTLDDRADVYNLKNLYENITSNQTELFQSREGSYDLNRKFENSMVRMVELQINQFAVVSDLKLEDRSKIESVRAEFENLGMNKDKVNNIDVLVAAEAKIIELEKAVNAEIAKVVQDQIDALPELSSVTIEHETLMISVREAYLALTESQKGLINVSKLADMDRKISELKEAAQKLAEDQLEADKVIALINALPAIEDLTLEHKTQLDVVLEKMDNITIDQRNLVTNISKLNEVIEAMENLEKAEQDRLNQLKVKAVQDQIDALPEFSAITLEHKDLVFGVRDAYFALEESLQGLVNTSKLAAADEKIQQLEEAARMQGIIDEFKTRIANLPEKSNITLENEELILSLRDEYNGRFSPEERTSIGDITKLTDAEAKIVELKEEAELAANQAAAKAVIDKIAALPENDSLTLDDKEAVEAARAAYDNLTQEQKDLVDNKSVLDDAFSKINQLEYEAQRAINEPIVKVVYDLIAALPETSALTLDNKAAVVAARTAYDDLNPMQKGMLINTDLLRAAEAKISELEAA